MVTLEWAWVTYASVGLVPEWVWWTGSLCVKFDCLGSIHMHVSNDIQVSEANSYTCALNCFTSCFLRGPCSIDEPLSHLYLQTSFLLAHYPSKILKCSCLSRTHTHPKDKPTLTSPSSSISHYFWHHFSVSLPLPTKLLESFVYTSGSLLLTHAPTSTGPVFNLL